MGAIAKTQRQILTEHIRSFIIELERDTGSACELQTSWSADLLTYLYVLYVSIDEAKTCDILGDAASMGSVGVIRYLMSTKACLDVQEAQCKRLFIIYPKVDENLIGLIRELQCSLSSYLAVHQTEELRDLSMLKSKLDEKLELICAAAKRGWTGIDVNARDRDNVTALHRASTGEVAQLLIDYGAEVDAGHEDGYTPLFTSLHKPIDVMLVLLRNGADADNIDANDYNLLRFLVDPHCNCPALDNLEIIEKMSTLIRHGADLNVTSNDGSTLLHLASKRGNVEIIEFLIQQGADANSRDEKGRTPLHIAVKTRQVTKDVCECLLRNGADIDSQDFKGRTPLHSLACYDQLVIEALIAAGPDVNIEDRYDTTAGGKFCDRFVYRDSCPMIIYVVKLRAAGLRVIPECSSMDPYVTEQAKLAISTEVEKLRGHKLGGSIFLLDILHADDARYLSDEAVLAGLEAVDYEQYPEYRSLIKSKINKDVRYANLSELGRKYFAILMERSALPALPYEVQLIIMSRLSGRDCYNLFKAVMSVERSHGT